MNNRLQDLEGISNGQKQKILELQDLASVQKEHLSSVECGAKEEVEKLKLQIQQLQGSCFIYFLFIDLFFTFITGATGENIDLKKKL